MLKPIYPHPYIKICGITNQEDALLAAQLGANAIGLNFIKNKSPRAITPAQAKNIIEILPPFITTVAVVADMPPEEINKILKQVPINILQFHGSETAPECERFNIPFIKALHIKSDSDVKNLVQQYASASAILLDAYSPQQLGGTGITFNWKQIPNNIAKPVILAGGLTSHNVAQAIRKIQPYAVDVCSSIEISPGKKDPEKLTVFIHEVKQAYEAKD